MVILRSAADVAELKNAAQRRELRKDLQVLPGSNEFSGPRACTYDVWLSPSGWGWNKGY